MATRLPQTDAVLLGVGLVGSMLGRELTRAGLKVVGLERGEPRFTVPDFQSPQMHDELRYAVRKGLMQDTSRETVTFRNTAAETALPIRRWEGFLPGTGLGGAAVHWNGQTYRFQDSDLRMRSWTEQRYGKHFLDPELQVQDWGVTAADLEPHYDRFEYLMGTSGKAGHLQGRKIAGGNPFEESRSREYPTPPQKEPYGSALFRKAAASLGYHPFPQPSCNLSQPYTNPEGQRIGTCMFCGYCERFGCEHFAKSSPQTALLPALLKDPNFTLRTQCQVLRINLDDATAAGHRRDLRRCRRARIRAAGAARDRRHVRAEQRAHAAALGHRQAVRPGQRRRRRRPQLRLPDHERGAGLLRPRHLDQPVHALGRLRHRDGRFRRRQLRPRPARLRRRRLHRRGDEPRPADRIPPDATRHAGLGLGLETRGRRALQPHLHAQRQRQFVVGPAATTSTSTRPTRTPGACRCCA